MVLPIFFINGTNDDGDSLDWFVVASDAKAAVALWRSENTIAPACSDTPRVFQLPTSMDVDEPRLLAWHAEVKEIEDFDHG